ncbi:hypothetical protein SAY87_024226 [Trapa incisa]|uniref:Uncharacterized protein n=1 Tax=Trapa incisa TaxID=236973 RepID=A0AAN7GBN1_9MYRT|nr:hypothetical protein SAY87_024226 [Trapa incisa]
MSCLSTWRDMDMDMDARSPITGASLNPARSLGPAIAHNHYRKVWIFLVAPTLGAISGAWIYNLIRFTDKPVP